MLLVAYHPHGDFAIQFCGAKRDTVFYGPRFAACSTACQVDAMTNRAFWSPIWPSLVAKDKKTLLFNMDFAYDFEGDMFVHLQRRMALSLDAVSDMQLDELKVVLSGMANARDIEFRFRGDPSEGLRKRLIERYGWS